MNLYPVSLPDREAILEILPVATLKQYQRVSHSYEDTILEDCIIDAFRYLDGRVGWLNRACLTQSWRMTLPSFCDAIEIPFSPCRSVDLIRYRDADDEWVTLLDNGSPQTTTDVCYVVTGGLHGRIVRSYQESWPTIGKHDEAVEIEFTAGWQSGDPEMDLLRRGMTFLAGHLYRNREETVIDTERTIFSKKVEFGMEALCGRLRIPNDHS
jgi:uncharacterized phiE125 gp8 family phage protein